jgi:hypothetical protein
MANRAPPRPGFGLRNVSPIEAHLERTADGLQPICLAIITDVQPSATIASIFSTSALENFILPRW